MKRMKLTTAGRMVIFVVVLALLAGIGGFGYNYYKNNIEPNKLSVSAPNNSGNSDNSGGNTQNPTTTPRRVRLIPQVL